jgi:hypothetical protein
MEEAGLPGLIWAIPASVYMVTADYAGGKAAKSCGDLEAAAQELQSPLVFRRHSCSMKILTATPIAMGGFYVLDQFLFNGQYTDLAIRMVRVAGAALGFYF